jgi:hypothetical protein
MDKWLGRVFHSSISKTEEFKQFARDFKKEVKARLGNKELVLEKCSVGHFLISGFIRNVATGKLAYFSVSDVRFFQDWWNKRILIRSAEHVKDFSGGGNQFCRLVDFRESAERITKES